MEEDEHLEENHQIASIFFSWIQITFGLFWKGKNKQRKGVAHFPDEFGINVVLTVINLEKRTMCKCDGAH